MRRLKVFGLAVAGMLALCATLSASALAIESPEFSVETGFTGTGGKSTLASAAVKIGCTKSVSELTAKGKKEGTFHLTERECTSAGLKCTSLGAEMGVISILGTWKLVEQGGLVLLSISPETHIECVVALVTLKGSLLTAISPAEKKTTSYELGIKVVKGGQEFVEYENEGNEMVRALLLLSNGGKEFEVADEESAENKLTAAKETELRTSTDVIIVKAGGSVGVGGGTNQCTFTAVGQKCLVRLENLLAESIKINTEELVVFIGTTLSGTPEKYLKKVVPGMNACGVGTTVLEKTFCTMEFELVEKGAQRLQASYRVAATTALGGARGAPFSFLG